MQVFTFTVPSARRTLRGCRERAWRTEPGPRRPELPRVEAAAGEPGRGVPSRRRTVGNGARRSVLQGLLTLLALVALACLANGAQADVVDTVTIASGISLEWQI